MAAHGAVKTPQVRNKRKRSETNDETRSEKRQRSKSPVATFSHQSDQAADTDASSSPTTPTSLPDTSTSRAKTFKCTYPSCTKAFDRPARLEAHKRSHSNSRVFKCPYEPCVKDFLRNEHLQQHIASAHIPTKNYSCSWPSCDKSFSTGTRLRRHEALHEKKDQFTCKDYPPCSETFRKHNTLQRHIETIHLRLPPYRCLHVDAATGEPCGAGFEKPTKLRSHEAQCHSSARYWCSFCSTSDDGEHATGDDEAQATPGFTEYADLQAHIRVVHPPYCTQCGYIARTPRELQQHMDIQHADTLADRRVFLCEVPGCGMGFTKRGNLAIHVRGVHENAKLFECGAVDLSTSRDLEDWRGEGACGGRFATKQTLEGHVRRHHLPGCRPKKLTKASKEIKGNRERKKRQKKMTAAEALTGKRRGVQCVIVFCGLCFRSESEMGQHCQTAHGMEKAEIAEATAERQALSGGRFWIGGDGEEEDDENEGDDDEKDGGADDFTGLDRPAVQIGGGGGAGTGMRSGIDHRFAEDGFDKKKHADMAQMLSSYLNEDAEPEDEPRTGVIDPALLSVTAG